MEQDFVVVKFGGTSMGHAAIMKKAAQIVADQPRAKLAVVSATSGTTNQLVEIFQKRKEHKNNTLLLESISPCTEKHLQIARELDLPSEDLEHISKLVRAASHALVQTLSLTERVEENQALDEWLSLGERLSSLLFTGALRSVLTSVTTIDARTLIRTDSHFGKAEAQTAAIKALCSEHLLPLLLKNRVVVTQGFIGADEKGLSTTLGRGGSDLSAALLAEGINAKELHIMTDVNGVFTMDPGLIPEAVRIDSLSFAEAAELANFGAKVLHPATLWPAIRKHIPVFVGSSFHPEKGGTWIYPETKDKPLIRALALRKKQSLITVTSLRMLNAHGFLARIFSILAEHKLSVDLVTTSEVSVALTIDGTNLDSSGASIAKNERLFSELRQYADVSLEEGLCLVALIGNDLTHTSGIGSRAFTSIEPFKIRLICHGASSHNLCFLVKSDDAPSVIKRLHKTFIEV
ncbi:MAG: lysine-sensitive aspartokinase 3 [Oligoflexales bacterium]|nr:lysine-sensitive aspartokinase 3 [Oligoflexales bacterium]